MLNQILLEILLVVTILIIIFVYFFGSYNLNPSGIKPDINSISFFCNTDLDCQLVGTKCCDNNAPTQNTCISERDTIEWKNILQNYCNIVFKQNHVACPEYFMEGNYSCFCKENRCWTNFVSRFGIQIYTGMFNESEGV